MSAVDWAVAATLLVLTAGSLAVFVWLAARDWRQAGRPDDDEDRP